MRKLLIVLFCLSTPSGIVMSQTVDEYTVGTGGDFAAFSEVSAFLDTTTAVRTIVFDVLTGEYNEHFVLNEVAGVSSDNQIIFQSAAGDPDSVRIYYEATVADSNYIITINGTDHLVIQNLTLEATGSQYGNAIVLTGDPNHIHIVNNKLHSGGSGRGIQGNSVSPDSLLVSNNIVTGFNDGVISLVGPGTEYVYGLVINQNHCTSSGPIAGIQRFNNPVITNNVQDNSATNASGGISLNNCYGTTRIEKNRIVTRSGKCIYIRNSGNGSARGLIANNFMEGVHGLGSFYGIDFYGGVNYDVFYNTLIEDHSITSFGGVFTMAGGNGNVVKNNLIVSRLGVTAIGKNATSTSESDYNNIYTSGAGYYKVENTTYRNLDSVKANTVYEQNSQDIYPIMTTLYEPYHQSPWLDGAGTPVPEVTDDIDGNPRDPSHPDIGCTEYTPDPSVMTPMSGEYTIGTGGDFPTINDAVDEVMVRGVDGLTEFMILPGEYKESIYLRSIPGTTEINEVIFSSSTGIPDDVHIQYPIGPDAASHFAFCLNGADHVGINSLTIERDTDYPNGQANVIYFKGETNDISIINNVINGSESGGQSIQIMYSYPMFTDRLYVGFNRINCLNYGSGGWLRNMSGSRNVVFQGNDYYCRDGCLDIQQAYGVRLLNNNFHCLGGSPLQIVECHGPIVIDGNRIIREAGYGHGFELRNSSGTADSMGLISNNFIQGTSPSSWFNGIFFNNSSYQNVYHNNINVTTNSSNTAAVTIDRGGSNLNFANNVMVNAGNDVVYRIATTGAFASSDFNDIYSAGANLIEYGGLLYSTLDSFQTVTGFDMNSVSVDPCFYSKTDLHVRAELLDGAGSFVAEVTQDFDGDYRTNPGCDIGADEFVFMPNDAPDAVDDSVTAYEDSTVWIDFLANDNDPNGDTLIATFWSNPAHGNLSSLTGSRAVEYTPNLDYLGTDSFYYVITDGLGCYDDTAWVFITVSILTDVIEHHTDLLPGSFELSQNYPNPFNPSTTIDFSLPEGTEISIELYNILGQKVGTLAQGFYPAGHYSVTWDGMDSNRKTASSGIYFYRILADKFAQSRKMLLLK